MATKNNMAPALMPVHPGEILKEELKERRITQKALAEQIGMRPSHLNELLNGKISMTIAIADKMQAALGIDSKSLMNLQTQYNYDMKNREDTGCLSATMKTTTLQVSIEDETLLSDIKRAIRMIRGVSRVAVVL